MRRIAALLASLGLLLSVFPALAVAAPRPLDTPESRIAGSWIVALHDGVSASTSAERLAHDAGGTMGRLYLHALNGFSFKGSDAAAAALLRNPSVRSVVADRPVAIVAESVPTGVGRIDATLAHGTEDGAGARVAILDTGIDLDHPDLVANLDTSNDKNCIGTGDPDDGHSHGTHVAGTVAAVDNDQGVIGVAPAAKLIAVKVLDDSGSGSWESVICGIDHVTALNQDGNSANDIDVANMSLGGNGSATGCIDGGLHEAICTSVGSGAVYAVAAGNDSDNAANHVPAAYPEVLTVSAFQDTNGSETDGGCTGFPFTTCDEEFASFSNFGSIVDVIAPGVGINSTVPGGYGSKSGTSMAAPHVAGVAALVRAADQGLTVTQVESILEGTGQCPDDSPNDGDGTCSGSWDGDPESRAEPMVNAKWAVDAATSSGGGGENAIPVANNDTASTNAGQSVTIDVLANDTDANGDTLRVAGFQQPTNGSVVLNTDDTFTYTPNAQFSGPDSFTYTASDGSSTSNSATVSIDVVAQPEGGIDLSVTQAYKVKGLRKVDLGWSGAASTSVDVWRNGAKVATTANDGAYTDAIDGRGGGTYTYKVCEAGTSTCSNEATASF